MNTGWLARVLRRLAGWVYRLTGAEVREHIPPPRDRRGRFTSGVQTAGLRCSNWAALSALTSGQHPASDQREWVIEELLRQLESLELPAWMLKAAVPLTQPANSGDVESVQRHLRSWVLSNMDRWIERRRGSVWAVFSALERTWAIDRLRYAEPRSVRVPRTGNAERVGAGPAPARSTFIAYTPPPLIDAHGVEHSRFWNGDDALAAYLRAAEEEEAALASAAGAALDPRSAGVPPAAAPAGTVPCEQAASPTVRAELVSAREIEGTAMDYSSTAGGREVRPYAFGSTLVTSDRRAACPRSAAPADPAPVFDAHFDVVGHLPKDLRERSDAHNISLGIGNTPDDARGDYIAKHKRQLGAEWRTYTFVPSIFEEYDEQSRLYFVAKPASPYRTYSDLDHEEPELAEPTAELVGTGLALSVDQPQADPVGTTLALSASSAATGSAELGASTWRPP